MRKHLMHTTGRSEVRFSTPESTESAVYLFLKPWDGLSALLTRCQFEQRLAIREMRAHTAARMHLYNYEIPEISVIYLPFSAFSTGDKQQRKEKNRSEVQKKASCVWVTGSHSELRLPASSGATQIFRLVAWLGEWGPYFYQSFSRALQGFFRNVSFLQSY